MDVLADVLSSTGFRGSLLAQLHSHGARWGCALEQIDTAGFHLVADGACWLRVAGRPPVQLVAGDVVLLPRGTAHELLGDLDAGVEPFAAATATKLPHGGEVVELGGREPDDSPRSSLRLICGKFEYAVPVERHPVLSVLPEVLHVPGMAADPELQGVVRLLASEASNGEPGSRSVATRLTEVLFVLTVRNWLSRANDGTESASWLTALGDAHVGRALSLMHAAPEHDWSVESLAAAVAMSRPTFARQFKSTVGTTPLAYLSTVRLDHAARMLRETNEPLNVIARAVGYNSEFTFSRAFTRERGIAPGRYRRSS